MTALYKNPSRARWETPLRILLVLLITAVLVFMALEIEPMSFPDEPMRMQIPYWIADHNALPTGYEEELLDNAYGFSYASMPPLPALLSAFLIKVCRKLGGDLQATNFACRLPSILSVIGSLLVCFRIGDFISKTRHSTYLLSIFSCFLPQVLFVGSYCNADSAALFGCWLTLYFLIRITQNDFDIRCSIGLAFGLSVILLSYYNAYGCILAAMVYCIVRCKQKRYPFAFVLKRFALVTGICCALCGWFFIRNAILYNGDFLGIQARKMISESHQAASYTGSAMRPAYLNETSILDMLADGNWIKICIMSFFCVLGRMDIPIQKELYWIYLLFTIIGVLLGLCWLMKHKKTRLAACCMLLTIITPVILSILYSYYFDYQPQGRYLFSALPAISVFLIAGYESIERGSEALMKRLNFAAPRLIAVASAICLAITGFVFHDTVLNRLAFRPYHDTVYRVEQNSVRPELHYYTDETYLWVRTAIWQEADQSDLIWWLADRESVEGYPLRADWKTMPDFSRYTKSGDFCVHAYGFGTDGMQHLLYDDVIRLAIETNMSIVKE